MPAEMTRARTTSRTRAMGARSYGSLKSCSRPRALATSHATIARATQVLHRTLISRVAQGGAGAQPCRKRAKGVRMLRNKDAAATIAVSDLDRAREFYENTLGLTAVHEDVGGILYKSGNSAILVYPSEFAGTNKATAATWAVGN